MESLIICIITFALFIGLTFLLVRARNSESRLRSKDEKLLRKLDSLDYDSRKYRKVIEKHDKIVNKISSRYPSNLPKREHGWYLPNDD